VSRGAHSNRGNYDAINVLDCCLDGGESVLTKIHVVDAFDACDGSARH
jgi:hypothetical protein